MVTLKVDGERAILHFTDVDQINHIHDVMKRGRAIKRYLKIEKNYVKNQAKKFQENGLLQRVGKGMRLNKKYLKYEVDQTSELWDLLSKNYTVQTKSRMVIWMFYFIHTLYLMQIT